MKDIAIIPIAFIMLLLVMSCKKNGQDDAGTTTADSLYVLYGPGYVPEPANHYYKITGSMVIEDTSRILPADAAQYNDTLPDKNNILAGSLLHIPNKMIRNNGKQYSNDRIADCASFVVTAFINSKEYNWTLQDCYDDNNKVKEYIQELKAAIAEFQK